MPYRPTERTQARMLATRERIVSIAMERVARGGFAAAGVQQVASGAQVAVGTVYRHFSSKGELFAEVFRQASQRELDVVVDVSRADGRSAPERVGAAVEAFSRRALAGPVLAYALIAEPVDPAVEAERLRLRTGYRDAFATVLEDGVRDGELRPHDTRTVAAALVGALAESLVGPLHAARAGSNEALIATLVQFCQEALPRAHERIHA
jgi:AcrR family transcriptional regulator